MTLSDKASKFIVIDKNGQACSSVLVAKTPAAAAKKAYRHCLRSKLKNKKQRRRRHAISVKRKDSDKVFTYMIKEHYAPTVVKIAGKDVKFRYTTSVKSVKKSKSKSKSKSK